MVSSCHGVNDKAKISIGEPGIYISMGVRGKKSIVPVKTVLGSLDHDMTKCSLTPSVYFKVHIPESIDKSFYCGNVYLRVNDSVSDQLTFLTHSKIGTICRQEDSPYPKIMLKFSDGGTDQCSTQESVKMTNII